MAPQPWLRTFPQSLPAQVWWMRPPQHAIEHVGLMVKSPPAPQVSQGPCEGQWDHEGQEPWEKKLGLPQAWSPTPWSVAPRGRRRLQAAGMRCTGVQPGAWCRPASASDSLCHGARG